MTNRYAARHLARGPVGRGLTSLRWGLRFFTIARNAFAASESGCSSTNGLPESPPTTMRGSSGTRPRKGSPSSFAASSPPPTLKMSVCFPQCGQTKPLMFSMTPRMSIFTAVAAAPRTPPSLRGLDLRLLDPHEHRDVRPGDVRVDEAHGAVLRKHARKVRGHGGLPDAPFAGHHDDLVLDAGHALRHLHALAHCRHDVRGDLGGLEFLGHDKTSRDFEAA